MNRVFLLVAALVGCAQPEGGSSEDAGASPDSDILEIVRAGMVNIELGEGRTHAETAFYVDTVRKHPAVNASRETGSPECSEQVEDCRRSVLDACAVTVCSRGRTWRCPTTAVTNDSASAGAVTLGGGDRPPLVIPAPRIGSGIGIATSDEPFERWTSGQEVEVRAAGAMVPAFTGRVKVPAAVDLMPAVTATTAGVPRSEPFEVHWTPGAEGVIAFGVSMDFRPDAETTMGTAVCTAPASAGVMRVPALSALLSAAATDARASMYIRQYQQAPVKAGDFAVQITVQVGPTLRFLTPVR